MSSINASGSTPSYGTYVSNSYSSPNSGRSLFGRIKRCICRVFKPITLGILAIASITAGAVVTMLTPFTGVGIGLMALGGGTALAGVLSFAYRSASGSDYKKIDKAPAPRPGSIRTHPDVTPSAASYNEEGEKKQKDSKPSTSTSKMTAPAQVTEQPQASPTKPALDPKNMSPEALAQLMQAMQPKPAEKTGAATPTFPTEQNAASMAQTPPVSVPAEQLPSQQRAPNFTNTAATAMTPQPSPPADEASLAALLQSLQATPEAKAQPVLTKDLDATTPPAQTKSPTFDLPQPLPQSSIPRPEQELETLQALTKMQQAQARAVQQQVPQMTAAQQGAKNQPQLLVSPELRRRETKARKTPKVTQADQKKQDKQ